MSQHTLHPSSCPTTSTAVSPAVQRRRAAAEDVAVAAARLDQHLPGWWRHIDIALLDQASLRHDVLGQLCGDYPTGLARLGLRLTAADQRGFTINPAQAARFLGSRRRLHALFAAQTAAWSALIRSRRTSRTGRTVQNPAVTAAEDHRDA